MVKKLDPFLKQQILKLVEPVLRAPESKQEQKLAQLGYQIRVVDGRRVLTTAPHGVPLLPVE